jgi:hypothetical protein
MLPIIAAAARAGASAAARSKAASAGAKAARAKKASDEIYNARRRYTRKAERYMKQADKSYGAARERYMELAKREAEKALSTYDKEPSFQKLSKGLQRVTLETNAQFSEPANDAQRQKLISRSRRALESNIEDRREYEGRAIMSSSVGSRIIASLESIWRPYAEYNEKTKKYGIKDWDAVAPKIFEHMSEVTGTEITDWMGVIEAFEKNPEIGADLYKDPKNDIRYDAVVQAAQAAFNL